MKGKSLLPLLSGEVAEVHEDDEVFGWEIWSYDVKAVRQGDWKIVWDEQADNEVHTMLFNVTDDVYERNDLSDAEPEKFAEMSELWNTYVEENGVIYQER